MLHACVERFDVIGGRGNILGWVGEVNKALACTHVVLQHAGRYRTPKMHDIGYSHAKLRGCVDGKKKKKNINDVRTACSGTYGRCFQAVGLWPSRRSIGRARCLWSTVDTILLRHARTRTDTVRLRPTGTYVRHGWMMMRCMHACMPVQQAS
jgi:hypothetical protein